tara:strand:- start:7433 stop:7909 length:477 start_codon:yes stop_codon:yes gene_type:complete
VRNAPGALVGRSDREVLCSAASDIADQLLIAGQSSIDPVFQHMGWPKQQHLAWQNGYFLARLRVPANSAALLADVETAERRDLYCFTRNEMISDLFQNDLYEIGRLIARQSDLLVDGFAEVRTSDRSSRHVSPHWLQVTVPLPKKSVNISGMDVDVYV